ncbi:MAG: hypothetical protein AAF601_02270 [Pseudomonadota bacterium]
MKPQFAISLSFQGIRLLRRAAGGWRRVGDVAVSTADLPKALSALRETALGLSDGALRSMIILPDDQIKYLSLHTGDISDAARRIAAEQALDGATPYPVDALVFDICPEGSTTHVAAVARETLAEAEAFASEHRFNPVCFVAAPTDEEFLGAPWFGETAAAQTLIGEGESIEPDPVRVVMVGDEDETPALAPTLGPEDDAETVDVTEVTDAAPDEPRQPGDAEPAPTLGFASRRSSPPATAAPSLGGVTRNAGDTQAPPAAAPPVIASTSASTSASAEAPANLADAGVPRFRTRLRRATGGFASRRKPPPDAAPQPNQRARQSEAERMTVFGARSTDAVGGKPKYLGLALTASLILAMIGVGAYASLGLGDRVTDLVQRERTLASTLPDDIEADLAEDVGATTATAPAAPETDEAVAVAALNEGLSDGLTAEDAAVLDALRDPLPEPQQQQELNAAQLDARYAVTGIWPKAPDALSLPPAVSLEGLYRTSIDPRTPALDAVDLPSTSSLRTDQAVPRRINPAAPGTSFPRDDAGRILATPEGTLSPDGFTVYTGRPPVVPPDTPARLESDPGEADAALLLAGTRPRARPDDLLEQNERAVLGGLSRAELALFRPRLRPQAPQELQTAPEPQDDVEEIAAALPPVDPVLRPNPRPQNFAGIVARAQPRQTAPTAGSTVGTEVASVAPRAVTPAIPSAASVTREATVRNAINLRRVNLIGVYGTPADRRALVRLANGRYKKVQVGDRFDGGRVSAIGDSELRYQKGGRNVVLKMPSG